MLIKGAIFFGFLLIFTNALPTNKDALKLPKNGVEVVEIDDYSDNYYTVNLTIGTPPQHFTVKLDTSSPQLLIEQVNCDVDPPFDPTSTYGPTTKNQFDPANSSTIDNNDNYCSLNPWGGGDGTNPYDTIQIGNLIVEHAAFCMLHDIDYYEHYTPYDGTLGLGFMDEDEDYAIMPEIMKQVDQPIFTIWLDDRKSDRQPGTAGGLLTFGGLDADNCELNWDFVNLTKKQEWPFEWMVDITLFEIGKYASADTRQGRIFSGDKYLYIATSDYHITQFNYVILEYVVECNRRDTLPDMKFTIGGREFSISANEYLYTTEDLDDLCIVGVYPSNELEAPLIWSLGEAFMRAHCVAFDYEKKSKIGFAKALKNNSK